MSNEINFSFISHKNILLSRFADFSKLQMDSVTGDLYVVFEIFVYNGSKLDVSTRNAKYLFSKPFSFKVESLDILKEINEKTSSSGVEKFFERFASESDYLDKIKNNATRYLSQEVVEPVYFESFEGRQEFIRVDEDTDFNGNFWHDGEQGVALSFWYDEDDEQWILHLSGTDDDSLQTEFRTYDSMIEEIEKLRKIQPINRCDLQKYQY
jgi:hypothetical protein